MIKESHCICGVWIQTMGTKDMVEEAIERFREQHSGHGGIVATPPVTAIKPADNICGECGQLDEGVAQTNDCGVSR